MIILYISLEQLSLSVHYAFTGLSLSIGCRLPEIWTLSLVLCYTTVGSTLQPYHSFFIYPVPIPVLSLSPKINQILTFMVISLVSLQFYHLRCISQSYSLVYFFKNIHLLSLFQFSEYLSIILLL